jgi:hypothetical protein
MPRGCFDLGVGSVSIDFPSGIERRWLLDSYQNSNVRVSGIHKKDERIYSLIHKIERLDKVRQAPKVPGQAGGSHGW